MKLIPIGGSDKLVRVKNKYVIERDGQYKVNYNREVSPWENIVGQE